MHATNSPRVSRRRSAVDGRKIFLLGPLSAPTAVYDLAANELYERGASTVWAPGDFHVPENLPAADVVRIARARFETLRGVDMLITLPKWRACGEALVDAAVAYAYDVPVFTLSLFVERGRDLTR